MMWASQVVFGISLPISSAALCPRSVWAIRLPSHGKVASDVAQGRVFSFLLFNLLVDSFATFPRAAVSVRLVDSDPFCHVCQLFADDMVILAESQAHLQHVLDVMHAWGLRWRFSFGIGPTKLAVMVFGPLRGRPDCSVHLGVTLPLMPQYRFLGVTLIPTLSCARGDRLFHQVYVWCRGEGLSLSLSPHLSLSLTFQFIMVWSSSAMAPQHFSNSTSRSVAGVVIFLGGPVLLLSQQFTGSLALAMHSTLPSDVHSLCLVFCVSWTTLPLALQTLPMSSGSVRPCKAHGRIGARPLFSVPHLGHVGISLFSSFGRPMLALSRSHSPWTATCALRLADMASNLHGVRVVVSYGNFLSARENPCLCGLLVGVTTSPSQAAPPTIGLGLPLALLP